MILLDLVGASRCFVGPAYGPQRIVRAFGPIAARFSESRYGNRFLAFLAGICVNLALAKQYSTGLMTPLSSRRR